MKNLISIIFLLISYSLAHADNFNIGGKELDIPSPQGFARVTEQMDAVYRVSLQMSDPMNDQLAYYIAESDVPAAMAGEMPSLERYFILKVNKKIKDMVVGSKDFEKIKSLTKKENNDLLKTLESKTPGLMESTSKGISKEFDVDFALQLSQVVPLTPHHETDNSFAYSMYINYGVAVEGEKEEFIVSATATYVNAAGKVLFLYCYGPQENLEWTRNASKEWAGLVLSSNSLPPSRSSGGQGFDWSKVFEKGIVGAITGGLIALIFGVFSRRKKKG